jgi:predicted amidohydrolase
MQDLKVVLVQTDIVWENISANLENFERKIEAVSPETDLILLPEMFTTGFTMNTEQYAETEDGAGLSWMDKTAGKLNAVLAGSLLIRDHNRFYNRFFWVRPGGNVDFYDKRHLFTMAGEQLKITGGKEQKVVSLNDWNFGLQVCYDLRFPVWSKNNFSNGKFGYDVLIYVANWPEIRNHAYKSLVVSRAIENQCYVIWVNRVGYDNNRILHSGDSMVVDPSGKIIAQAGPGNEETLSVTLSGTALVDFRDKFRFSADWDKFTIQL